jgi:dolichol-phosphate mannosyltransferase
MNKKAAIIVPTFYEEQNIKKLIKDINKRLKQAIIFIVDDTPEPLIEPICNEFKNVRYFHRKNKRGRGSAVIFGIKKALKNKSVKLIIEMDADFSHNPNELNKKINYFNKKKIDLLIASRYLKESKIINWSLVRRIFSILSNMLARLFLKINIRDFTNGFRFYSIRSAKKIVKNCGNIGDGFIILSEIIVVINNNNFKIKEQSTTFINRKRGESSVNLRLILQSLFGLIKLTFIKKNL